MASNIDNRQLLRWFTSVVTALTSSASSGGGTTSIVAMITSVSNMNTADSAGLGASVKAICTQISSAVGTTTPSSSMATIL